MSIPLISCVCPTFGKTKHLNEAVESFHRQNYPNKELIIFNNYPHMNVIYDHPQVKVVNYKEDIYSIGACRNKGNEYTLGDYICTWDDDDISLSGRLNNQWGAIAYSSKLLHASVTGAWYSENNSVVKRLNLFMSSTMITSEYLRSSGGYPNIDHDDQYMYNNLVFKDRIVHIKAGIPQYIYRWGTGTYHVSGLDLPPKEQRASMMKHAERQGLPPTFTITPYWERDYEQDVKEFVNMKT